MEQWKLDAIFQLMANEDLVYVEDTRAYTSSPFYGKSRYHLLDNVHGESIQFEQINSDEKWGSRVVFQRDELRPLLKFLMEIYLEQERQAAVYDAPESLGDLDDHPF